VTAVEYSKAFTALFDKFNEVSSEEGDLADLLHFDSNESTITTSSRTYLGYQLLWLLRLALHGRVYPLDESLQFEAF